MRRLLTLLLALAAAITPACAQRHSGITSPPTAPTPAPPPAPPAPIVAVSSGLGPLQFTQANSAEPAPESLARQLQAEDNLVRSAALSAIGTPAAYINREPVPTPHSVQVTYVALGNTGELDAILTAELDLHIVSAILVPSGPAWHRIATVTYATTFADPATNLGTFLRIDRSLIGPDHYTAIFHGVSLTPDGDLTEHEAHLNVINGHAVITISFVSRERTCETAHLQPKTPHADCEVTERWLQPEPTEGDDHAILISAKGRVGAHDAVDPISRTRLFNFSGARTYECQPFLFSDQTSHYEPTANSAACFEPKPPASTTTPKAAPSKPLIPSPLQHP
ncbi:MAG TPA: hypothetical protein VHY48_11580 [Acidobacteriaceae bacterium]|jgi:hypothetical protein|nr:hypothetical protein [Acidobacteriaceae bacterium]